MLGASTMIDAGSAHVFLWGMPGSGKTTAGARIGPLLGLSWFDLDDVLERETGKSIPEIFQASGEKGFRELEAAALRSLVSREEHALISCGGGTPCHHGNAELMKRSGLTIYLDCSLELLLHRLKEVTDRPVLVGLGEDRRSRLEAMLEARWPIYRQAHRTLHVNNDSEWILALAGVILQWQCGLHQTCR